MTSLEEKMREYMDSSAGKKKLQDTLHEYIVSGATKTRSGQKFVTKEEAESLAKQLIDSVTKAAVSADLPESVQKHFNSLTVKEPVRVGDNYKVAITFSDDLRRDSIKDKYEEDPFYGVDNIVALFNNGYTAHKRIYGYWYKHSPPAGWIRIASKLSREPLHFMNDGVKNFNADCKSRYVAEATVGDIYKQDE